MDYKDTRWLLDLCSHLYLLTRHMALQGEVANFIGTCDLDEMDVDYLRKMLASFRFHLCIMEIRCRLSFLSYEEEHGTLRKSLVKR